MHWTADRFGRNFERMKIIFCKYTSYIEHPMFKVCIYIENNHIECVYTIVGQLNIIITDIATKSTPKHLHIYNYS